MAALGLVVTVEPDHGFMHSSSYSVAQIIEEARLLPCHGEMALGIGLESQPVHNFDDSCHPTKETGRAP